MIRLKNEAVQPNRRYFVTNWEQPDSPQVLTGQQPLDEGYPLSCAPDTCTAIVSTYGPE